MSETNMNMERLGISQFYKANGFTSEDVQRPIIGIANSFSEVVPGHANLRTVAERVKLGIAQAGGMPVEFGVIGCCDGIAHGYEGNKLTLPSREIIASSVEVMAKVHRLDGLVLLGSCDKIVPGMLMGAARLDIPCIFLPGGPMISGAAFHNKPKADVSTVEEALGMYQSHQIPLQEVIDLNNTCNPTCG